MPRPYGFAEEPELSVVAPSLRGMPLMIVETTKTGPDDGRATRAAPREHAAEPPDECRCDACRGASRDEMWIRWA
jgi:hypothetical protein